MQRICGVLSQALLKTCQGELNWVGQLFNKEYFVLIVWVLWSTIFIFIFQLIYIKQVKTKLVYEEPKSEQKQVRFFQPVTKYSYSILSSAKESLYQ